MCDNVLVTIRQRRRFITTRFYKHILCFKSNIFNLKVCSQNAFNTQHFALAVLSKLCSLIALQTNYVGNYSWHMRAPLACHKKERPGGGHAYHHLTQRHPVHHWGVLHFWCLRLPDSFLFGVSVYQTHSFAVFVHQIVFFWSLLLSDFYLLEFSYTTLLFFEDFVYLTFLWKSSKTSLYSLDPSKTRLDSLGVFENQTPFFRSLRKPGSIL